MNLKLTKRDWLILFSLFLMTLTPLIISQFFYSERKDWFLVFSIGFIPIFLTHATSIGLRFRKIEFSFFWILMIVLNGLIYNNVIRIWISMVVSFGFYNLLSYLFEKINKEVPIPITFVPSMTIEFNKTEKRMENKRDVLFSLISFFAGHFLSIYVLLKAR